MGLRIRDVASGGGEPTPFRRRKGWAVHILQAAVAAGLLVVIFLWIDLDVLKDTLAAMNPTYMVAILIFALVDRFLMALKWNLLLRAAGTRMTLWECVRVYLSSGFVGTFLPSGVGGDAYRAVRTSLGRRDVGVVTASIIVERVIGLLIVTLTALTTLGLLVYRGESQLRPLYLAMWLVLAALAAAVFVSVHPSTFRLAKRLLDRHARFKIVGGYLKIHGAYAAYGRYWGTLLLFGSLSLVEVFIVVAIYYLAAMAIGLNVGFIYFAALIPLSFLVTRLPISIAAIGVKEGAFVYLFSLVRLAPAESLSLSLIGRAIELLMLIPTGAVFLVDSFMLRKRRTAPSSNGKQLDPESSDVTAAHVE